MKAIGIIVLLLVIGLGVVTFMVTKEPDRTLDAQGQTWVDGYHAWRGTVARQVNTAERNMSFETPAKNARLLAPLRSCGRSLARIGEPPALLKDVKEAALLACGEAAGRAREERGVRQGRVRDDAAPPGGGLGPAPRR